MTNTTETTTATAVELDAIVELLDAPRHVLPEKAFAAARQHQEQIVPRLIALIEQATQNAKDGNVPVTEGHFFALFLLTEFRATEACQDSKASLATIAVHNPVSRFRMQASA